MVDEDPPGRAVKSPPPQTGPKARRTVPAAQAMTPRQMGGRMVAKHVAPTPGMVMSRRGRPRGGRGG